MELCVLTPTPCGAVVLGGTQPPANMWGQQQVAGPPPQVPASGQSMGQAVADISAGLRLMQQSPGSSLPPWPLPPVLHPTLTSYICAIAPSQAKYR